MPKERREKAIDDLSDEEALSLLYDWDFWAREGQLPPQTDWQNWLLLAGRGYGKTRTGAEMVRKWVDEGVKRIALVAETPADARDIMIEGESGLLNIFPPWNEPHYESSKRRITWNSGAMATVYSGYKPDQLRGPQHEKAWADELASWRYPRETWDNLMFGMRLGENPQSVITTTPRPLSLLKELIEDEDTVVTRGTTYDNIQNLPEPFYKRIISKYEGTRLGRQELYAEILSDNPGALWNYEIIQHVKTHPSLKRIVVAIDPEAENNPNSSETGIVAGGVGVDGYGYVLADKSVKASPNGWAQRAVDLYDRLSADRIVGEVNQGGEMVEAVIRSVDGGGNISYNKVRASRGKKTRAEPVASLYEQGKVFHVGQFPELEDQLTTWEPGKKSPDRLDALVWLITELMLGEKEYGDIGDMEAVGQARASSASQW